MPRFDHYDQGTPSWVELSTPDQQAAQGFYGALFGWSFEDNDMGEVGHYYISQIDGDDVAGVGGQLPGMEDHPAFWGVYLAVDDVDAATAKVEAAGGKVEAGPFDVDVSRSDVGDPGPDRCPGGPVAGRARPSAPSAPTSPAPPSGTRS